MEKQHISPPKPEKPLDSDCCGQGCTPCILDIYQEELDIWKRECERLKTGSDKSWTKSHDQVKNQGPVLSPTEYTSFQIVEILEETHNSRRFRLCLPKGSTLGLKTGQHVVIRAEVDGEVITRQYTPVTCVHTKSYFELLIKVYEKGKMSQLVREWTVGTQVQMRGPCGHFKYSPNQHQVLYMFAVGTGLAPMAQCIQTVLGNEDDETLVQLHYGCQTYCDIPLKPWIDEWSRYWNFSCSYYLSQEDSCGTYKYRYGDTVHKTRISKEVVQSVIDTNIDKLFVLVCGTRSFEKDMIKYFGDMGISNESFHKF